VVTKEAAPPPWDPQLPSSLPPPWQCRARLRTGLSRRLRLDGPGAFSRGWPWRCGWCQQRRPVRPPDGRVAMAPSCTELAGRSSPVGTSPGS
jgi:hypothetical protein